jgi:hypothetical protein
VDYKNRFQNIFCNSDANEMTNMKRKREDLQVEKKRDTEEFARNFASYSGISFANKKFANGT